jgi:hypothetical protein
MKIHHYHPETLEYLGEGQADESPLEPGVYLIPAHATPIAPPAAVAGKSRHFESGAWVQREIPPPPAPVEKTPEEIAAEEAAAARAREMEFALDALPALVAYVAGKADAPDEIRAKAQAIEAERVKVK